MNNETINYYNNNSQEYFNNTFNLINTSLLSKFCNNININFINNQIKILDLGCGSGRDSLFFEKLGFDVYSLDASKELALLANKILKKEVIVSPMQKINDLFPENYFDGVWAMASLLHLNKKDFKATIEKISYILKNEGVFFLSLKKGTGYSYDDKQRYFSYYEEQEIKDILNNYFNDFEVNYNNDSMGRQDTTWLSINCKNNKLKNNYKISKIS